MYLPNFKSFTEASGGANLCCDPQQGKMSALKINELLHLNGRGSELLHNIPYYSTLRHFVYVTFIKAWVQVFHNVFTHKGGNVEYISGSWVLFGVLCWAPVDQHLIVSSMM